MPKPLNQFGGWLRFLQITLILSMVLSIFIGLTSLIKLNNTAVSKDIITVTELTLLYIDFIVSMFLIYRIYRCLKINEPQTPVKIYNTFKLLIVISIFCLVIKIATNLWFNAGILPVQSISFIKGSIYYLFPYLIWMQYFQSSIRVYSFYGANA